MSDSTTDTTPVLSVVIAALNAEEVLGGQLAALASQSCPVPFEVLICDNGSTDGTVALAESWAGRLPVRVVDARATRGSGPARNAGSGAARGSWLLFCDADDQVGERWLAAACKALSEHEFVAGPFDDTRLNSPRVRRSRPNDQVQGLQYLTPGIGLPHGGAGNLGIHRAVFEKVGGFDPSVRFLQDTELCWRVQLAGHPLVFAPDMLVHVRLRASFRSMFRQGRNFGAAQAMLERRYAPTAVDAGVRPAETARVVPSAPRRSLVQRLMRQISWTRANQVSVGGQMWQLGWHLGHR